ncbi:Ca2+/Na+ antiporter [Streptomyces glaucescens]|jgi:hypothetical protein
MAHAAPVPRRTTGVTTRDTRLPDVFSARTHRIARWAWPVSLGLVYGYWAAANDRAGGPITGWNLLLGFASALAFIVLYMAVRAAGSHLQREVHALLWAVFSGCAFGFLYAQTGASVWASVGMGAWIGVVMFAVLFYRYYTHEDAEGRPTG